MIIVALPNEGVVYLFSVRKKMKKTHAKMSRDIGLEIGSIVGKYFLKLDHLHYGYWTPDLPVDIANLGRAQQQYTDFLVSHIPVGVKTVLDVGCGTGSTAKKLSDIGYVIHCVSPSHFQCEKVRQLCGNAVNVFECEFEAFQSSERYDLILFSESFQYIPIDESIPKVVRYLSDGGHLLVCDIFRKAAKDSSAMKGGHEIEKFFNAIRSNGLELVEDIDITEATTPNIELMDDVMKNVAHPVLLRASEYVDARYSLASKIVKWAYRKQIQRKYDKYFGNTRTGDDFRRTRTYRLLLCRKNSPVGI